MKYILCFLLVLLCTYSNIQSQSRDNYFPYISQQKVYGSNKEDYFHTIKKTNDGGFIITGSSIGGKTADKTDTLRGGTDIWVIKTDANFNIQWQKTLGGTNNDGIGGGTVMSLGGVTYQTNDNNYIVIVESHSTRSGDKTDTIIGNWILKLDQTGNILWQKTIGYPNDLDLTCFTPTTDSGFVMGGIFFAGSGSGGNNYTIIKVSKTGNVQWEKQYDNGHSDLLFDLHQTTDKGYILGGSTYDLSNFKTKYNLIKVNDTGAIQWNKKYENPINPYNPNNNESYLQSVKQTFDGGYILAGNNRYTQTGFGVENDLWIIKTDGFGNMIKNKIIGGNGNDGDYENDLDYNLDMEIIQTSDTAYVLGATSYSGIGRDKSEPRKGNPTSEFFNPDLWIMKLDNNLNIIWQKTMGSSNSDHFRNIIEINKNEFAIGAQTNFCCSTSSSDIPFSSRGYDDYWLIKLNVADHADTISGNVFASLNNDCIKTVGETGIPNIVVRTEPNFFYGITDSLGNYSIFTPHNSYTVKTIKPYATQNLIRTNLMCPISGSHTVTLNENNTDTSQINFAFDVYKCPFLKVDIAQARFRRCRNNTGYLYYSNIGLGDTSNVKVYLRLPPYLSLVTTSMPYTMQGNIYVFNIGNLKANQHGSIMYEVYIACDQGIMGLTQCLQAWITPKNECASQLSPNYNSWDKSELEVEGNCISNHARFVIYNRGSSMADSTSYKVFINSVFSFTNKIKINSGDSLVVNLPANRSTYRLEVTQRPYYPGNTVVYASIEECGTGVAYRGIVTQMETSAPNPGITQLCNIIRDSYDPNDKAVQPVGFGYDNRVRHKVPLDYTIQFQNTGNDTAYDVVVIDTLSENFDLSTLSFGAASHPYTVEFVGSYVPILKFNFKNINLVDSVTNETKSHGFIHFRVKPYDTIPNGTVIKNNSYIYFDFNTPIKTNTTYTTINDSIYSGAKIIAINAGQDKIICLGDSVLLSASGADSYTWNTGETTASLYSKPTVSGTKVYIVTGYREGFSSKDTVNVNTYTRPVLSLGTDINMCIGQGTALNASYSNLYSFAWSTGVTSTTIFVNPAITTTYMASGTGYQNSCSVRDTIVVNVHEYPIVDFTKSINGASVQFNAISNVPYYFWSFGDGFNSTVRNPLHTYASSGNFIARLSVTDSFNCSSFKRDTFNIIVTLLENKISFVDKIDVFPNPTHNSLSFTLHSKKLTDFTLDVIDLSGKILITQSYKNAMIINDKLNITDFSRGIYFLRFQSENQQVTYKLQKE